jgi:hypothetical protein
VLDDQMIRHGPEIGRPREIARLKAQVEEQRLWRRLRDGPRMRTCILRLAQMSASLEKQIMSSVALNVSFGVVFSEVCGQGKNVNASSSK